MTLGEKIRAIRKDKKLTLKDLTQLVGLSKSTVSDIECGKANPSITTLEKLSKAFNMNVDDILNYDKNSNSVITKEKTSNENIRFNDPVEAMEFILNQPSIMNFGNFDVSKLSDEDKINFANDMLDMIKMLSPKYRK